MKIYKFQLLLLLSLITFASASSYFIGLAQSEPPQTVWQYSVSSKVRLGVRQKQAQLNSFIALFTVTANDGKQYSAQISGSGDSYVYVEFPRDFSASNASEGSYNWVCAVGGQRIASGDFDYLESESNAENVTSITQAPPKTEQNALGKIGPSAHDWWLWAKIRSTITSDATLKDTEIKVDVENAVVTLTGKVINKAQKAKVEQLVRSVEDVKKVKNNIEISSPK